MTNVSNRMLVVVPIDLYNRLLHRKIIPRQTFHEVIKYLLDKVEEIEKNEHS